MYAMIRNENFESYYSKNNLLDEYFHVKNVISDLLNTKRTTLKNVGNFNSPIAKEISTTDKLFLG